MKKAALLSLFFSLFNCAVSAQPDVKADAVSKAEMAKLHFLTGQWAGEGWMMDATGKKETFSQTENIQFKLDSTALLIEGQGRAGGKIIHNALAVVTYNKSANEYKFQSFLSSGRGGSFRAELLNNRFHWYPNENMRYIIYLNEKGQWHERGEVKRGADWFQFFEMTLAKK